VSWPGGLLCVAGLGVWSVMAWLFLAAARLLGRRAVWVKLERPQR
jgi:protein-S-isoprenylcysteine O-methyltransferase Ste14